jgi:DNA (cytosine-5)-methyltransferase 1
MERRCEVKHLDLFSGIGGFTLAAEFAGFETIGFSEINPYASKVLKKIWPEIKNFGDIRKMSGVSCDILTGGFPCQPYSVSGRQLGEKDSRDLWPEMCRIIAESKPAWIVGENSFNVLNLAFRQIKIDLEKIGYEVGTPFVIPACAVNADHRRNRAWICAYSHAFRLQRCSEKTISRKPALQKQFAGVFPAQRRRQRISTPGNLRSYNGLPGAAHRIAALGNAIVPQVAAVILSEIGKIDAGICV